MVAEEHFGGFMQRKNPEDEKKSWKERMEDMIKESKKKKVGPLIPLETPILVFPIVFNKYPPPQIVPPAFLRNVKP